MCILEHRSLHILSCKQETVIGEVGSWNWGWWGWKLKLRIEGLLTYKPDTLKICRYKDKVKKAIHFHHRLPQDCFLKKTKWTNKPQQKQNKLADNSWPFLFISYHLTKLSRESEIKPHMPIHLSPTCTIILKLVHLSFGCVYVASFGGQAVSCSACTAALVWLWMHVEFSQDVTCMRPRCSSIEKCETNKSCAQNRGIGSHFLGLATWTSNKMDVITHCMEYRCIMGHSLQHDRIPSSQCLY